MSKFAQLAAIATICGTLAAGVASAETVILTQQHRTLLGDWVISQNNGACPAGSTLVKKDHWLRDASYRCVVPRNKPVTFYAPGTVMPSTVTYAPLPTTIVSQLPPAPEGEIYVTADHNIYLIKPETRTVVEGVAVVGTVSE